MSEIYPKVKKIYWRGLILLSLFTAITWIAVFSLQRDFRLRVAVLDIGQGDAILATTSLGFQILIDGGPAAGGILRALAEHMPFFDRTLELVIATHADADHIGGLIDVLKRYRVRYVLTGDVPKDTATFREFEAKLAASKAEIIRPRPGMKIWLGRSTLIEALGPPENFVSKDSNETSIVARLRYGKTAVMLTGDAPTAEEEAIIASGAALRADLLKIGHHGSRTSTGEAFLSAVAPDYAAISVGRGNRYGHPVDEIIARLKSHGTIIDRTDEQGTIEYSSDGAEMKKR